MANGEPLLGLAESNRCMMYESESNTVPLLVSCI